MEKDIYCELVTRESSTQDSRQRIGVIFSTCEPKKGDNSSVHICACRIRLCYPRSVRLCHSSIISLCLFALSLKFMNLYKTFDPTYEDPPVYAFRENPDYKFVPPQRLNMSKSSVYTGPVETDDAVDRRPTDAYPPSEAALEPEGVSVTQSVTIKEHEDDETSSLARSITPSHSYVSQTSTEEYCQTPFEEFSLQVRELCQQLWMVQPTPEDDTSPTHNGCPAKQVPSNPKEFILEKMKGGSYNRVIGVDIIDTRKDSGAPTRLVLRVPRSFHTRLDRDVAILRFVRKYTSIPVPEVVRYDFTKNNPLGSPYLVQTRIPGHNLQNGCSPSCYPNLSHKQKCIVAKEIGRILREIQAVEHSAPGHIEANFDPNGSEDYTVRYLEISEGCEGLDMEPGLNTNRPFFQPRIYQANSGASEGPSTRKRPFKDSTYYFLLVQFGRLMASQLRRDPATIGWSHHYERLAVMARQMDDLDLLGDDTNCLCHLDLNTAPRNIMAHIDSDESLTISGILDWDSAIFAPRFGGCVPPMWIWAWSDDEEDEAHANDAPDTLEQQELKQLFEEAVGPKFLEYAYRPEYRLARRLFRIATDGMRYSQDFTEVESLLAEWATTYKTYSVNEPSEEKHSEGTTESNVIGGDEITKESSEPSEGSVGSSDTEGDETVKEPSEPSEESVGSSDIEGEEITKESSEASGKSLSSNDIGGEEKSKDPSEACRGSVGSSDVDVEIKAKAPSEPSEGSLGSSDIEGEETAQESSENSEESVCSNDIEEEKSKDSSKTESASDSGKSQD